LRDAFAASKQITAKVRAIDEASQTVAGLEIDLSR
jgi:hypothetical protein